MLVCGSHNYFQIPVQKLFDKHVVRRVVSVILFTISNKTQFVIVSIFSTLLFSAKLVFRPDTIESNGIGMWYFKMNLRLIVKFDYF